MIAKGESSVCLTIKDSNEKALMKNTYTSDDMRELINVSMCNID